MKRNDWILAAVVLLAAGILGAYLLLGRQTGSYVMISKDNEEIGTYEDCPDQICVHTGWIDQEHDMIVCMPNKVVVQIVEQ